MKIALVDTAWIDDDGSEEEVRDARASLTLSTIGQIVAQSGNHEIYYVPEIANTSSTTLESLVEESTNQLANIRPDVIFLSVYSAYAGLALNLGRKWKQEFGSKIVLGGRHFEERRLLKRANASEELIVTSPIREPISSMLLWGRDNGGIDFVYSGQGGNIPQLLRILEGESMPDAQGIYYLEGNTIHGNGRSKDTDALIIPVANSRYKKSDMLKLSVVVSDTCTEHCRYCASPAQTRKGLTKERADQAIRTIIDNTCENTSSIMISDSNPIRPDSVEVYDRIIREVRKARPFKIFGMYLDTAYLADPAFCDYAIHFINSMDVMTIFIGRDCITEAAAKAIGRNYRGQPRTQEMLDAEKEAIGKILSEFNEFQTVAVSYILAPHLTSMTDVVRAEFEMDGFASIAAQSGVKLKIMSNILQPFPGTQLTYTNRDYDDRLANFVSGSSLDFWRHHPQTDTCYQGAKLLIDGLGKKYKGKVEFFLSGYSQRSDILVANPTVEQVILENKGLKLRWE